jgi:hypothetical protein
MDKKKLSIFILIFLPSLIFAHGHQIKVMNLEEIKKLMLPQAQDISMINRKLDFEEIINLKNKNWLWNSQEEARIWIGKDGKGNVIGSFILSKEKTHQGIVGLALGFAPDLTISKIELFEYPVDEKKELEYLIKTKNIFNLFLGKKIDTSLKEENGLANTLTTAIVKSALLVNLLK